MLKKTLNNALKIRKLLLLQFLLGIGCAGFAQVEGLVSKVDSINKLAWSYRNSQPDKTIINATRAIEIADSANYSRGKIIALSYTGVAYRTLGNYSKALEMYHTAKKIAEDTRDSLEIGYCLLNIGNVYIYREKFEKAIENVKPVRQIAKQLSDDRMLAYYYLYYGRAEIKTGNFAVGKSLLDSALQIRIKINDEPEIAVILKDIGEVLLQTQNHSKALESFNKALEITDRYKTDFDLISDINNQIARIHLHRKEFSQAIARCEKSFENAQKLGSILRMRNSMETFFMIFDARNMSTEALKYHKLYYKFNDSLNNENTIKKITQLEMLHVFEKKEQEQRLIEQRKAALFAAEIAKQKTIKRFFIASFILTLLLGFFIYRSYRIKQKANVELQQKNALIIQQKEEITASIVYAERIQKALLPPAEELAANFAEHFILFRPRDIVSGDFYWVKRIKNFIVFATADSTGHGVPGAFMSMLGMSFLSDIVTKSRFDNTGEILNRLRNKTKKALNQKGQVLEQKDGFDIALFSYNIEDRMLEFSGAYNPVIIIREKTNSVEIADDKRIRKIETPDAELIEIKADRQPVSIHIVEKDFSTYKIQLYSGDCLYTFSDGYYDQPGGRDKRKFMSNNFKQLLLKIFRKPMHEQLVDLETNFDSWKNEQQQIDDVLVVGIRIP